MATAQPPRVAFGDTGGDVKEDGSVQIRVKTEMDEDVVKAVDLNIVPPGQETGGGTAKYFVARVKSGPGSKRWKDSGLTLKGLQTRGSVPQSCRLLISCGESIMDDMAKRRMAAGEDTPRTKKKRRQKRLQKEYVVVFEAIGVDELPPPNASMPEFWQRVAAGELGATVETSLTINVKQKKQRPVEAPTAVGDGEAEIEGGAPDYVGLSILIAALLFAIYVFLLPIPDEILPPCNATLNITDHCVNASALNETLTDNITDTGEGDQSASSEGAAETYDGENDEGDDDEDDAGDEDDEEEDYSAPGDTPHGELRRRL